MHDSAEETALLASPLLWFHLGQHRAPDAHVQPLQLSLETVPRPETAARVAFARLHTAEASPQDIPDFFARQPLLLTVGDRLKISSCCYLQVMSLHTLDGKLCHSAWVDYPSKTATLQVEGTVTGPIPTWCDASALTTPGPIARALSPRLSAVLLCGPRGVGKRHAVYELGHLSGVHVLRINCHTLYSDSPARTETHLVCSPENKNTGC